MQQEVLGMAKKGLLKVDVKVVREDGVIPYDDLNREEKAELGKRLNQRAISAVAKVHGFTVDFVDKPPATETA